MSIASKLTYLAGTKNKIKNSINLTGVNITNEDTFRSYSDKLKQGLLDVLNNGNDYLYNNFPQTTGTGTNITLNNTLEAPIKSELLGNTSQKTTTGKNLAEFGTTKDTSKYTYNSYSADNIDVEKTATGGSFYASYILHIPSAGTYRFKGNILYDNQQFYIYSDRLYGNLVKTGSFSKGEIVYSWAVEEAGDYIIGLNGSTIRSYGVQNFMIIPSSITDDTYEPYTNGASPNPDYPQEVKNATGGQVVKVSDGSQEQSYEINLGKNLFNYNDLSSKIQTFNISGTADEFTITGIGTYQYPISLKGQHTISGSWSTTNLNGDVRAIYEDDTFDNVFSSYSSSSTSGNINFQSNASKNIKVIQFRTFNSSNITLTDFQIEKGSTATSYSPYFTPIELCKIGDYQDVIKKGTGINLYNKSTIIEGKYINNTGAETSNSNYYATDYIEVNPDKYLFLNGNTFIVQGYGAKASFYDENKQFITYVDLAIGQNIFIVPNNAKYFRASIYKTDVDNLFVSYEPYGFKDKWYLYKAIGKYTFTGNENWNVQATDNNFTTFQRPDILPSTAKATNYQQGLCKSNYFKTAITWNIWTNTDVGIDAYVKRILITIPSSIATTKTQLNQWLQEHNVYLDYVLETPTIEEITDSTLLNDLNNLEDAKSYNGTTNITITAETPADIKITALKNE